MYRNRLIHPRHLVMASSWSTIHGVPVGTRVSAAAKRVVVVVVAACFTFAAPITDAAPVAGAAALADAHTVVVVATEVSAVVGVACVVVATCSGVGVTTSMLTVAAVGAAERSMLAPATPGMLEVAAVRAIVAVSRFGGAAASLVVVTPGAHVVSAVGNPVSAQAVVAVGLISGV